LSYSPVFLRGGCAGWREFTLTVRPN